MGKTNIFIKKLVLFALIFIILDFAIGTVLEYFYFSKKSLSGGDNKLYYSLNKTNAEILIFGASTAIHGYIPQIIEDSLGISCYNTGWNGTSIYFSNTILNSVLQRYLPKVVIFDMTAWEFIKEDDDFDKLYKFTPIITLISMLRRLLTFQVNMKSMKCCQKHIGTIVNYYIFYLRILAPKISE